MAIMETRKRKRTTTQQGEEVEAAEKINQKKNNFLVPPKNERKITSTKVVGLLPDVCWTEIFSFVSSSELSQSVPLVCKTFNNVCIEYDNQLWKSRCEHLWSDKVKSSYEPFLKDDSLSFCNKYSMSIADSKRCDLSVEELCSFSWAFRFKANAGRYWMNSIDPYWMHLKDIATATEQQQSHATITNNNASDVNINTVRASNNATAIETNSSSNNNTNSITLSSNTNIPHMIRRFKNDGSVHNPSGPKQDILESRAAAMNMEIKWKLTKTRTHQDGSVKEGNYLSLPRYPSSGIERTNDWGWTMQNQLVAFVYPAKNLLPLHNQLENDIDRWI